MDSQGEYTYWDLHTIPIDFNGKPYYNINSSIEFRGNNSVENSKVVFLYANQTKDLEGLPIFLNDPFDSNVKFISEDMIMARYNLSKDDI
jgi:hypothetical protein